MAPGGIFEGAIAITGLGNKRLRNIELALSCIETSLVESKVGPAEVSRRTWKVFEGTPEEGVGIPFRIAIPQETIPTFQSSMIRIDYALDDEASVVVQKGGVYLVSGLERFIAQVQVLAIFWARAMKKSSLLRRLPNILPLINNLRPNAEQRCASAMCLSRIFSVEG